MAIMTPLGIYIYTKHSQQTGWERYAFMFGGAAVASVGLLMIPLWSRVCKYVVSRMTLEVESGMLRIERPTFWWPWRPNVVRVPVKSVITGVSPLETPSGEVLADRLVIKGENKTQLFVFKGDFTNKELFEQISSGTYVRPYAAAAHPGPPPANFFSG